MPAPIDPASSARPEPLPIRWRDRILVPPAPRNTALITGHPARTPTRHMVNVTDPVSGTLTPIAVWHYRPERPATDHHAPPLVMVHGFRGDHHGLALLADCLPEAEIYLPELPGFGHSPAFPDAEHSVAHSASAVGMAVQEMGLIPHTIPDDDATALPAAQRPLLIGHSYGSVVASHLAAQDTERWAGLALLNPICEPALDADGSTFERLLAQVTQGYYEVSAALPERLGLAVLGAPLVVWITGTVMTRTQDRRVLSYLHDQHQQYFSAFDNRQVLVESYRASTAGTVLDSADALRLPVLLVAGAQDELGSVAGQHALAERIRRVSPAVRLQVLEGVGHLVHYERAPEAAALIRQFQQGLS